ncbi:MAG: hypothetical protein B6245_18400 [Desulfobacteraceae bacterium 4572_88]|nr:MAG: hypothetical protein B6245_18400 [Desulfobacteraceae bacterium 4572_88]RLC19652.1 MAG: hypothetical protein DRI57_06645 [Deltaproteobacteria bacterium]
MPELPVDEENQQNSLKAGVLAQIIHNFFCSRCPRKPVLSLPMEHGNEMTAYYEIRVGKFSGGF